MSFTCHASACHTLETHTHTLTLRHMSLWWSRGRKERKKRETRRLRKRGITPKVSTSDNGSDDKDAKTLGACGARNQRLAPAAWKGASSSSVFCKALRRNASRALRLPHGPHSAHDEHHHWSGEGPQVLSLVLVRRGSSNAPVRRTERLLTLRCTGEKKQHERQAAHDDPRITMRTARHEARLVNSLNARGISRTHQPTLCERFRCHVLWLRSVHPPHEAERRATIARFSLGIQVARVFGVPDPIWHQIEDSCAHPAFTQS